MQFLSTCWGEFLLEKDRLILKSIGKEAGLSVAKTILKKKNKVRGLISLDCETYYKATVVENSMKLASGWADGPLEYNRDPGNKPSHIWCYGLNIVSKFLILKL